MTTKTFTPAELEAARAQIAKEDAERAAAARAEALAVFQPLIDAGVGSDKPTTVATLIPVLEATLARTTGNDYTFANCALIGLRGLTSRISAVSAAPVAMPVVTAPTGDQG